MLYWGSRQLAWSKFLRLDALSCMLWAVAFGGVGYLFSSSIEALIGEIRKIESHLVIGLVLFAVLMLIRYLWIARSAEPEAEPLP
jgi:membrane protein DedA with SNARE-associated domain